MATDLPVPEVREISATQLKAMMDRGDSFELIDVRTPQERATAMIAGSRLLDQETYESLRKRRPERVVEYAVTRMLPKSKLGRAMGKKLKVYKGAAHPHQSQQPAALKG